MRTAISWFLCSPLLLACGSSPPAQAPAPANPEPAPAASGTAPTAAAQPEATARKGCACELKLKPAPSAAAPSAPPPISGELPAAPFDVERRSACTAPVCRLSDWLPDPAFANTTREGVPSQGAVWLETIADKSTLVLPATSELESIAVVLEGKVSYGAGERPAAGKSAPAAMGAWSALRAPNAGYYVTAQGGKASVLVAVLSRTGTLAEAIERAKKKGAPKPEVTLEPSDLSTVPHLEWARGAHHARVAYGATKGASLSLLQASGRGAIPENVHVDEWEHIVVLRGGGEMLLGNAKYAVGPGSVFHVPKGTPHGWTGTGDDLAAIILFSPGGPEQRFVGAAKEEGGRK